MTQNDLLFTEIHFLLLRPLAEISLRIPWEMDTAAKTDERTIAVLSPDYFTSHFTPSEWAAAFRRDPKGEHRFLVPVRVRECDVEGLLGQIVSIDMVGQDEQQAHAQLLAGVRRERAKPSFLLRYQPIHPPSLSALLFLVEASMQTRSRTPPMW